MQRFSQRKRFTAVPELIQVDSMNEPLRNSVWNVLELFLWSTDGYLYRRYGEPEMDNFSKILWFNHFKKPIDSRPDNNKRILEFIRDYFFSCPWYKVYDFLEFTVSYYSQKPILTEMLNSTLERELSGYRIISGQVIDITDKQEVNMLEEALRDTQFKGVTKHLQRALELLSDRGNPDYRNSIKESISAVESIAKIIANKPDATLGEALRVLERNKKIHPALKDSFSKLYGYTSDQDGIRHAMLNEPNLTAADAKFFLLSCTSFVNYLKAQL
jgi:hypothetical protein